MKVIDIINNSKKTLFSFELLPPLKGNSIVPIYKAIDPLMQFSPSHINITYHQEEVVYKKLKNGLLEKKTVRKRPGTVAISAAIKYKYPNVEVVPHIICGGFTKEETEYALIDFHFLGIDNILVLRGDPPKTSRTFITEKNGHSHASELISQIIDMNQGKYLDNELENSTSTDFCIGVAGYPEKHIEAPNLKSDLRYLKEKINNGAEYIVTQMFFDNQKYFDFVKLCREEGINVPIIPGIKPITTLNDIKLLPQIFNIDIPEDLEKEIKKCSSNEQAFQVGIEWGIKQSKELVKFGVPALHYFTIGISENIKKIAETIF
ncbi:MAG: methylenetetrahydrofolate reductase [NAD(P)H] [Bacteroidetes bacterium CG2_30_32_10]|nr:MAG: methylenetetrahydrofolate reductase [NAD(P)H] [Bacteroidetes bacterium CG2_30_32_10]